MPKLTFYKQGRADAAVRTGIELDDEVMFKSYEESGELLDPTLLRYVDLRCTGSAVPSDPHEAKRWLLDNGGIIREDFTRRARDLEAGRDVDLYSLLRSQFSGLPDDVEMTIACATNRRIWAVSVPELLNDVSKHWRERLAHLAPAE